MEIEWQKNCFLVKYKVVFMQCFSIPILDLDSQRYTWGGQKYYSVNKEKKIYQHHMGSLNSYEMNFSMVIFIMHACANLSSKYLLFFINYSVFFSMRK
jgi:hypothetical protein